MSTETAARWSLVAVCDRCRGTTLIVANVPEGLSKIQGTYFVKCRQCGEQDSFPIARVEPRADFLVSQPIQNRER